MMEVDVRLYTAVSEIYVGSPGESRMDNGRGDRGLAFENGRTAELTICSHEPCVKRYQDDRPLGFTRGHLLKCVDMSPLKRGHAIINVCHC